RPDIDSHRDPVGERHRTPHCILHEETRELLGVEVEGPAFRQRLERHDASEDILLAKVAACILEVLEDELLRLRVLAQRLIRPQRCLGPEVVANGNPGRVVAFPSPRRIEELEEEDVKFVSAELARRKPHAREAGAEAIPESSQGLNGGLMGLRTNLGRIFEEQREPEVSAGEHARTSRTEGKKAEDAAATRWLPPKPF